MFRMKKHKPMHKTLRTLTTILALPLAAAVMGKTTLPKQLSRALCFDVNVSIRFRAVFSTLTGPGADLGSLFMSWSSP